MEKLIAIHGLGYVGLTAAVHYAKTGWTVIGYDPDVKTIEALQAGKPRAGEFLSYLDADVAELVRGGARLAANLGAIIPTTSFEEALAAKVHSLAVPTEKDGQPWDELIMEVLQRLVTEGKDGSMILVESTLTPGTIDKTLDDEMRASMKARGIGLAVCPRRDWFADPDKNLHTLLRNVGGLTQHDTTRALEVLLDVSPSIDVARGAKPYQAVELTKAMENAWLHTAVMMATEMAIARPDLDIAEATRMAGTHWRLPAIFLGPGCGGRCVPLGTRYLIEAGKQGATQTRLLPQVNQLEHEIRVACARAVAQRGAKTALVLGIAYRPDFRDMGNSPGLDIARIMRRSFGIEVAVYDPLWSPVELADLTGLPVALHDVAFSSYDAVVLATPHSEFMNWPSWTFREGQFVLDCQGAWLEHAGLFAREGIEYVQVGSPDWLESP